MTKFNRCIKRLFDIFFSTLGLLMFWPVILITAFIARLDTGGSGFFLQKRVGMNGVCFLVIKIRTMRECSHDTSTITVADNLRITRIGRFFRKAKVDELPQLWNVFIGQMSFVGPRPDVPGYADKLFGEDTIILTIRPGITGPASLHYKYEEELLARKKDPVKFNNEVIWPDKVKINRTYIKNYNLMQDILYIWKTIVG